MGSVLSRLVRVSARWDVQMIQVLGLGVALSHWGRAVLGTVHGVDRWYGQVPSAVRVMVVVYHVVATLVSVRVSKVLSAAALTRAVDRGFLAFNDPFAGLSDAISALRTAVMALPTVASMFLVDEIVSLGFLFLAQFRPVLSSARPPTDATNSDCAICQGSVVDPRRRKDDPSLAEGSGSAGGETAAAVSSPLRSFCGRSPSHVFHRACIEGWYSANQQLSKACPLCRSPLMTAWDPARAAAALLDPGLLRSHWRPRRLFFRHRSTLFYLACFVAMRLWVGTYNTLRARSLRASIIRLAATGTI